jgi:phosphoglycerol geranylgeranyltransferase
LKVLEYIYQKLQKDKMHMTLIDPADTSPLNAGKIAGVAARIGTDAIMVGGSTGITTLNMDAIVKEIRLHSRRLPIILFPSSAAAISRYADAIYFMSLLNSRNVRHIVREQAKGAPVVKKMGIEPISMGYLIIEPGMKVGEVGEAEVIPRDNIDETVGYALAAQYLGMQLLYLEAGSGAPEPVPPKMIMAVKHESRIPLIVGGGIRTKTNVDNILGAGADIIVTGTAIEAADDLNAKLTEIIGAVKNFI